MNLNRKTTTPMMVPRSLRRHRSRRMTTLAAGKMVPLFTSVMFREDAVRSGRVQFQFEMNETAELLMNAVYVNIKAYLVPWLAFERFDGSLDAFNRSYNKQPAIDGGSVIPFFETHAMGASGSKAVYKALGLHEASITNVNTQYVEAYNAIWNERAQARSKSIPKRNRLDTSLAPAFWNHTQWEHLVPDFDQAVIDGEVALDIVGSQLAVKAGGATRLNVNGIGFNTAAADMQGAGTTVRKSDGTTEVTVATAGQRWSASGSGNANPMVKERTVGGNPTPDVWADLSNVYAELAANGITVSLSNIELARKTQAFARIREQYVGFDDAWIIDMLMDGLSIPDQALKKPMLLAETQNVFGMNKRYSTDATALAKSAVNGATVAQLSIRVPRLMTGGVIMVVAEIVPEQLFERAEDPFFTIDDPTKLPEFLRDFLDTQKVEVVKNRRIDVAHATPNGTFGYEPLNGRYQIDEYRIGGRFYRPETNTTTDEARQRLWSVETVNPTLAADFFLCTNIHQKPFLDTVADPFEAVTVAELTIEGNTVFGGALVEAMNNYAAVKAVAPTDKIVK